MNGVQCSFCSCNLPWRFGRFPWRSVCPGYTHQATSSALYRRKNQGFNKVDRTKSKDDRYPNSCSVTLQQRTKQEDARDFLTGTVLGHIPIVRFDYRPKAIYMALIIRRLIEAERDPGSIDDKVHQVGSYVNNISQKFCRIITETKGWSLRASLFLFSSKYRDLWPIFHHY